MDCARKSFPPALLPLLITLLLTVVAVRVEAVQPPSLYRSSNSGPSWPTMVNKSTAGERGVHGNRIIEDVPMGCKELRSKRYISDGFCTSVKPITEVVCSGFCLPVNELPWYTQYVKMWSRKAADEWRCVDDVVRHKRVYLLCENGERRSYRIRVVRACKCKKFRKNHNKTAKKKDREKDGYYD